MRILDPVQELTWDELDLYGENEFEGQTFTLDFLGDGSSWSNPQPIETWVRAMLLDGSIGSRRGHDNRTPTLVIRASAETGPGLAAADAALALTGEKQGTALIWTPPDGDTPATVFDVDMADVQQSTDFDNELRLERIYTIALNCQPFARSLEETYEEAVPATGVAAPTVIDECTATTGWSSPDGTVIVYSGQAVGVAVSKSPLRLVRSTLDLSDATRPYLRIKWGASSKIPPIVNTASGSYQAIASQGGYSWYEIPDAVYGPVTFTLMLGGTFFRIWQVAETASVGLGTRRELARTMSVGGSARTLGRLVVDHPSNGLGNVLVFTYPEDLGQYSPPLMPYRTGGTGQTAEATNVAGTKEPINGTPTFTIPAEALPSGYYRIVLRMRHTSTAAVTISWSASVAGVTSNGSGKVKMDAANTWQYATIDGAYLPPVRIADGADRDVTFSLTTATAGVEMDTGWLLHSDGVVTIVAAGSEKTVTIESASPEFPAGMLWVGDHYPGAAAIGALGQHEMTPPRVLMHTVTDGTEDATVGLYHYARWRHFAGA